MKTKEIELQIKKLEKQREELTKEHITPLSKKLQELEKQRKLNIIKNKEFVDLKRFEGKNLSAITALDSKGNEIYLPLDEIVEVKNGKLYCSSYEDGIVRWDTKKKKYVQHYYYSEKELDIIGFIDVDIEED